MEIVSKITGGTLSATEFNQIPDELEGLITTSGQTPASGTLDQVGKAVAAYAATSTFYTDSGSANAYTLTSIGSFKQPDGFTDGLLIRFRPGNANTGASQVTVLGSTKDIKKSNGTSDLSAGDIPNDADITIRYDLSNTVFVLDEGSSATDVVKGASYLDSPITISNGADPDHDIDFTAGNFNFFDKSGQATMTAKTGELDVLFGTADGMLDAGSIAIDEVYYLFTVYNPTTKDSKPLSSISKTSPTMTLPNADGYTILGKQIADLITDGSANILPGAYNFRLDRGYSFELATGIQDVSTPNPGTSAVTVTMTTPPNVEWIGSFSINDDTASGNTVAIIGSTQDADILPSFSNFDLLVAANSNVNSGGSIFPNNVITDSSSQVRYRLSSSTSSHDVYMTTKGWTNNNL